MRGVAVTREESIPGERMVDASGQLTSSSNPSVSIVTWDKKSCAVHVAPGHRHVWWATGWCDHARLWPYWSQATLWSGRPSAIWAYVCNARSVARTLRTAESNNSRCCWPRMASKPVTVQPYPEALHGFLEVNRPDYDPNDPRRTPEQESMCRHCEGVIIRWLRAECLR